jgi:hypothetical protein
VLDSSQYSQSRVPQQKFLLSGVRVESDDQRGGRSNPLPPGHGTHRQAEGSNRPVQHTGQLPRVTEHLSASMLSNTALGEAKGKHLPLQNVKAATKRQSEERQDSSRSRRDAGDSKPEDSWGQVFNKSQGLPRHSPAISEAKPAKVQASTVNTPRDPLVTQSLQEQLQELSQMPSIHEMATSNFCPPPLYYFKVLIILILENQPYSCGPTSTSTTAAAQYKATRQARRVEDGHTEVDQASDLQHHRSYRGPSQRCGAAQAKQRDCIEREGDSRLDLKQGLPTDDEPRHSARPHS